MTVAVNVERDARSCRTHPCADHRLLAGQSGSDALAVLIRLNRKLKIHQAQHFHRRVLLPGHM